MNHIENMLNAIVARGKSVQDQFIADCQTKGVLHTLSWAAGAPEKLHEMVIAKELLTHLEKEPNQTGLENCIKFINSQLDGWYPKNSTSAYSNATHSESYRALINIRDILVAHR